MKKLFIILLVTFMMLPIVFCGEEDSENPTNTNTKIEDNKNVDNKLNTRKDEQDNKQVGKEKEQNIVKKLQYKSETIKMATTTSTENSGLLDKLLPTFTKKTGIKVKVIAVGTGAALELGGNGDVDVVLVHARPAEDAFVEAGYGVTRRDVMYNDFVILGPAEDPAGIKEAKTTIDAFKQIAKNEAEFISRGDDSGTHKKEKIIWKKAQITPEGNWYKEAGKGMGDVITMANQLQAYTLADRGTYLSMKDKIKLEIVHQGDEMLFNPYGIIAVNPEKHKHVKYKAVMTLIEWITSKEAQKLINNYKVDGEQLFYTYE